MTKNKKIIIGIGALALTVGFFAFTLEGKGDEKGKMKKYEVIHQSGGTITKADTLISMSSDFTPEAYLKSLGIDAKDPEIVKIPNFNGKETCQEFVFKTDNGNHTSHGSNVHVKTMKVITDPDDDHIVMKGEPGEVHDFKFVTDGDEKTEIIIKSDDNGKTFKKFVNGEEVEFDPKTDMIDIDLDMSELSEDIDGLSKEIEIKVIKSINGLDSLGDFDHKHAHVIKKFEFDHDMDLENMSDEDRAKFEKEMEQFKVKMEGFDFDMDKLGDMEIKIDGLFENDSVSDILHEKLGPMMEQLSLKLEGMDLESLKELKGLEGLDAHVIMIKDELSEVNGDSTSNHDINVFHTGGDEDFTIVLVTENIESKEASSIDQKETSTIDLDVFPNPAKENFTLALKSASKGKTSVEIVDVNGKVVYKDNLGKIAENHSESIDVSSFESGMYFVKVKQGKSTTTKKLMVQ